MRRPVPAHVKAQMFGLRKMANGLRGMFGMPVYLCGSALQGMNPKPRDWDIRIMLPDADFKRRFGIDAKQWANEGLTGKWTEGRWRWSDECVKQSKMAYAATGLNIDLQIYPAWYANRHYRQYPKLKLDTRPKREGA